MICKQCGDIGWIAVELLSGPGEYRDPSGYGEVRCSLCNWRPSQDMPDAVADLHDAAIKADRDMSDVCEYIIEDEDENDHELQRWRFMARQPLVQAAIIEAEIERMWAVHDATE